MQSSIVALQQTLKSSIHCVGVGLHSGARVSMTLHPADVGTGIVFRRTDRVGGADILARWDMVVNTRLCTVLGNDEGDTVGTVEHLMAAFAGCAVDNVLVELDGPEVPVMDGSSAPFVFLIECAGLVMQAAPRRALRMVRPVRVGDATRSATLWPAESASFEVDIDFPSAAIMHQRGVLDLTPSQFKQDVSRARTFGFVEDMAALRKAGLGRGGSLDNAIVIDGDRILNEDGLRYPNEFVRHKILDSVGDLYLAGLPIIGHFHGVRCGHAVNNELLHALFASPSAFVEGDFSELAEADEYASDARIRATA